MVINENIVLTQWRFVECLDCHEEYFPCFGQLTFFCGITSTVLFGISMNSAREVIAVAEIQICSLFLGTLPLWLRSGCMNGAFFQTHCVCVQWPGSWFWSCQVYLVTFCQYHMLWRCVHGDFVFFCCLAKELCFYCSKLFTKMVHFRVWFVCKLHRHINLDKKIESCENVRRITLTRLILHVQLEFISICPWPTHGQVQNEGHFELFICSSFHGWLIRSLLLSTVGDLRKNVIYVWLLVEVYVQLFPDFLKGERMLSPPCLEL